MTYSTIADVRAFGVVNAEVSDARITWALTIAKQRIDKFLGRSFDTPDESTETIDGVSSNQVALPPYSDITEVTVNGVTINDNSYETRDYGIWLKPNSVFDADGFVVSGYGWSAFRRRGNVTVTVTATFGEVANETIELSSTILASGFARLTADDNLPPAQISSTDADDVRISQRPVPGITTGNLEVDAMLDGYGDTAKLVD